LGRRESQRLLEPALDVVRTQTRRYRDSIQRYPFAIMLGQPGLYVFSRTLYGDTRRALRFLRTASLARPKTSAFRSLRRIEEADVAALWPARWTGRTAVNPCCRYRVHEGPIRVLVATQH
jgi:hypothetical protein